MVKGDFEFELVDGRRIAGRTAPTRPASDLSWRFWFVALTGVVTFLIGSAVWAFRREVLAVRILAVGGAGFLIAAACGSLVQGRELTLSPLWFRLAADGNHLGLELLFYSMMAILWYYPKRLGRFPFAALCYALVFAIWANETFQLFQIPLHPYGLHYLVGFIVIDVLGYLNWRESRHDALARASLQWFLLTVTVSATVWLLLFSIPMVYSGRPIVPVIATFAAPPIIYLGFAFGIARYRLFDLERWWLEVWLWLAGGLLVMGIDFVLVTLLDLAELTALGVAIILAGWVYLPVRQWLFRRMFRPTQARLEEHFLTLMDALLGNEPRTPYAARWQELLQRVFAPLSLTVRATPVVQTGVVDAGLGLCVPALDGTHSLELRYQEQGRRLYSPRDAALADTLLALTRRVTTLSQAREEGARTERSRIMRDLHDDVAARLLSLVHRASDSSQQRQAREALGSLRQVIYALDDQQPIALADFIDELQALVRERLRDTNTTLEWQEPAALPAVHLSPRERINLMRVVQEAISNALRHASPSLLAIAVRQREGKLYIQIGNDGVILQPEDWIAGKGLYNIRTRMNEIGGDARWTVTAKNSASNQKCCLELSLPLPDVDRA